MIDPAYNPNDSTGPRKSRFWALRHSARVQPRPWRWPLDNLDDREPIVLAQGIVRRHGIDFGFESRPDDATQLVPVYAAQDGEVMHCSETSTGYSISIDHQPEGWATYYGHLSNVCVPLNVRFPHPLPRVRGGEVIGYAARSPIHLRFALWQWTERGFVPVEPTGKLSEWVAPLAKPNTTPLEVAA